MQKLYTKIETIFQKKARSKLLTNKKVQVTIIYESTEIER